MHEPATAIAPGPIASIERKPGLPQRVYRKDRQEAEPVKRVNSFMQTLRAAILILFLGFASLAQAQEGTMKIRLTVDGKVMHATLLDNATARDFVSLLPLTLTLEDYASTEKVSYLPRKLSTTGAPAGSDPSVGDITYYAPWGNLAIFYKDFGYASGLIPLGRFDSGIEGLSVPGKLKVTIERAGK